MCVNAKSSPQKSYSPPSQLPSWVNACRMGVPCPFTLRALCLTKALRKKCLGVPTKTEKTKSNEFQARGSTGTAALRRPSVSDEVARDVIRDTDVPGVVGGSRMVAGNADTVASSIQYAVPDSPRVHILAIAHWPRPLRTVANPQKVVKVRD